MAKYEAQKWNKGKRKGNDMGAWYDAGRAPCWVAGLVVTLDPATTTLQSEIYTLICIIEGDDSLFFIEIPSTGMVGTLKMRIKEMKPDVLADITADKLTLYRINISIDPSEDIDYVAKVHREMGNLQLLPRPLHPLQGLAKVFNNQAPPLDSVHIFVRIPPARPGRWFTNNVSCHTS